MPRGWLRAPRLALNRDRITLRLWGMGGAGARRLGARPSGTREKSWTLESRAIRGTLLLRFVGPTPTQEIGALLAALTRELPEGPAHIVFDIRELEGHNSEVRAAFQRWLMENRARVGKITVVVNKAATIFKMAASVVRLATSLDIQIRDDLESDASVSHLVG